MAPDVGSGQRPEIINLLEEVPSPTNPAAVLPLFSVSSQPASHCPVPAPIRCTLSQTTQNMSPTQKDAAVSGDEGMRLLAARLAQSSFAQETSTVHVLPSTSNPGEEAWVGVGRAGEGQWWRHARQPAES